MQPWFLSSDGTELRRTGAARRNPGSPALGSAGSPGRWLCELCCSVTASHARPLAIGVHRHSVDSRVPTRPGLAESGWAFQAPLGPGGPSWGTLGAGGSPAGPVAGIRVCVPSLLRIREGRAYGPGARPRRALPASWEPLGLGASHASGCSLPKGPSPCCLSLASDKQRRGFSEIVTAGNGKMISHGKLSGFK